MEETLRFVRVALLAVAASAAAHATGITIAGHQGHSTAALAVPVESAQPTISYWRYRQQQIRIAGDAGNGPTGRFHYGSRLRYRPDMVDRSTFRYYHPEFSRRRYDGLRGHSQRGRLGGRGPGYQPGARYTNSFGRLRRGPASRIRYGLQRTR